MLHGGVIAALLDGVMTHRLFQEQIMGVTAELVVRYRHPVLLGHPAMVRGWIVESEAPLYRLQAQLWQDNVLKATARAIFMMKPELGPAGSVPHDAPSR